LDYWSVTDHSKWWGFKRRLFLGRKHHDKEKEIKEMNACYALRERVINKGSGFLTSCVAGSVVLSITESDDSLVEKGGERLFNENE